MKRYPKLLDDELTCVYPFQCPHHLDGRRSPWHAAVSPPYALCCPARNVRPWNTGSGQPPWLPAACAEGALSCSWPTGTLTPTWPRLLASNARSCASGRGGFWPSAWKVSRTSRAVAPTGRFPPEVAMHVVRLACERP